VLLEDGVKIAAEAAPNDVDGVLSLARLRSPQRGDGAVLNGARKLVGV
jgi:hypothetical protein